MIRKNETAEVRPCIQPHAWEDSSEWWWTEGNGGCDCNRHLYFERAGGVDPHWSEGECSEGKYTIVEIIFPDGTSLDIEEDPYGS